MARTKGGSKKRKIRPTPVDTTKVKIDQAHLRTLYKRLAKVRTMAEVMMSELRVLHTEGTKVDWDATYDVLELGVGTQPPEEESSADEESEESSAAEENLPKIHRGIRGKTGD